MKFLAFARSISILGIGAIVIASFAISSAHAGAGEEGAAFLNIPVGARPAALGGSYVAQADDIYAPVWNPAGLGFVEVSQLGGMHLSFLQGIRYDFLGTAIRLRPGLSLGISRQLLRSGDIDQTDETGETIGTFNSHYGSYNVAVGQQVSDQVAVGGSLKWLEGQLSDVSAHTVAGDVGVMWRPSTHWSLASCLSNMGKGLRFLESEDPLPLTWRSGVNFRPTASWSLSLDSVYRRSGLASAQGGVEWTPFPFAALRVGYRTNNLRQLSAIAGLSAGVGLRWMGQEISYAWLPYGELGNTHYVSLQVRFGRTADDRITDEKISHLQMDTTTPALTEPMLASPIQTGPTSGQRHVLFLYTDAKAKVVRLVGDFEDAHERSMIRGDKGEWSYVVDISETRRQDYAFIVDGERKLDPRNKSIRRDITGRRWSVIEPLAPTVARPKRLLIAEPYVGMEGMP